MSYTDTVNNVVYAYTAGDIQSAYVTLSPDASGDITILKEFTVLDITYTVTSIGQDAFNGNILSSVTFPYGSQITSIGTSVFYNSGLETLHIPDSVTSIGESAFELNKISTFTGGINIETIGIRAFASNKLTSLTIPNKVKIISSSAFSSNSLITVMFLGSDVETIGTQAFQGNSLTKLFIPKSVSSLGGSAFRNNKLTEVYFFNVPSIGINCFTGNISSMKAYYLDGLPNNDIVTPLPFFSKTSQTLVQMLKPLLDETGVSVETLVNDDYTFIQIAEAEATASQLFGYFDNISSPVPLQSYIPYFTVSELKAAKPSLTIDNFKAAGANIQQVFDQFKTVLPRLSAMIGANYLVADIVAGVTDSPAITIADFKNAGADKQQMLTQFGLQALWNSNQYTVADLKPYKVVGSTDTVTVAQWWVLNSAVPNRTKPTVLQLSTGGYTLQEIWTGIYSIVSERATAVATIRTGLSTTVAQLWGLNSDSRPTVLQLYNGGYTSLQDLWNGIYAVTPSTAVSAIKSGLNSPPTVSSPTVAQWWALNSDSKPTVQELYNGGYTSLQDLWSGIYAEDPTNAVATIRTGISNIQTNDFVYSFWNLTGGKPTLQQLYDGGFNLSQIWDGLRQSGESTEVATIYDGLNLSSDPLVVTRPSVYQFWNLRPTHPSVQQLSTRYNLQQLWDVIQDVQTIYDGLESKPSVLDFKNLDNPPTVSQLYRSTGGYTLTALLVEYSLNDILTYVTTLTISDFKMSGASIQQVYDKYGLSEMINMTDPYTVSAIYTGVIDNTGNRPTVGNFKGVGAPIADVYAVFGYAAMVGVNYYVSDIVDLDNALTFNDFYNVAGIPAWNLMTYYLFSEYYADLLSKFTVAVIKSASYLDYVVSKNLTASDFLAANASIVQMLNAFSLAQLIHLYTTTELVLASQDAGVTVQGNKNLTIDQMKNAGDELYEVMNYYGQYGNGLVDLLTVDYTISDLVVASNLKDGSDNYLVTVTDLQDLGNKLTSFVTTNATIVSQDSTKTKLWNLINYFELSALLSYYSVQELNATSSDTRVSVSKTVTIASLKAASAPDQDMLTEFGLQAMWNAGYNVSQLKPLTVFGSVVTVTVDQLWTLTTNSRPTIQELYAGSYTLQDLWDYFADVAQIYDGLTVPPMVSEWWGLSGHPTIQDLYDSTKYGLQELWDYFGDVAQIYEGLTVKPMVSDWWDLTRKPTIQQLYGSTKYGLQDLWDYFTDVAQIYNGLTVKPTVALFWALTSGKPTIQQLYGSTKYGLQDLWDYFGDVAQIYDGLNLNRPSVVDFGGLRLLTKPTINQIKSSDKYGLQEVYNYFGLTVMINMTPNPYNVAEIYSGVTPALTIDDFKDAEAPIQQVYDQFKTSGTYRLSAMIGALYTVQQIVTDVTATPALTIADFKAAGAPIQQVYDQFNESEVYYRLSQMIGALYTVSEIYSSVTATPALTIDDFKDAEAPIQQVYDQFKTSGTYRLSAMIGALYTVQQIVTDVTATPALTIADFKAAGAPIQQVYNQFKTSGTYRLSAMINMETDPYTVQEIVAGVTASPALEITDFKTVNAPIYDVYAVFGYAAMVGVDYYVKDIVPLDNALTFNDFYNVAGIPAWNLMTYYLFSEHSADLLSMFTVSVIKSTSIDSRVAVDNQNRVASHFQAENASIVQMLNAFTLAELIHLYTTEELVIASQEAGVTVEGNKNLTIDQMKLEGDELYQVMNYYGQYGNGLVDLLTVDYTISDLVVASNLKDGSDNYLVTVTDLQDLGNKLTSFVTTNATIVSQDSTKTKLWNLINYFELSALLSYYSVHELNATTNDGKVIINKKVDIASLKAADTNYLYVQDMLTEFGLQAMWTAGYTVQKLKAVKVSGFDFTVTVAQLWSLNRKPTIQDLYDEYGLQDLWTGIYSLEPTTAVATIYDGLGDNMIVTVSLFWGLSSLSRPTVQELYDSNKYNPQLLWNGIQNMTTIYNGISRYDGPNQKPYIADFYDLTDPPSIQQLYEVYSISDLWSVYDSVPTIYDNLTPTPTIDDFYDAGASIYNISARYNLQQIWDYFGDVAQIYDGLQVKPSVEDWWGLTGGKPTLQELYAANIDGILIYGLQNIWNYFGDVAQIYDGLTVKPTVAQFWGLSSLLRPTVQELYDSNKYNPQLLWTGIYDVEPTTAVATIYDGLTVKPTVSLFWGLSSSSRPTVQELYGSTKYGLQNIWTGIYAVEPTTAVATIYDGLTVKPTVAQFWALISGKPTIQQLYDSTKYGLQDLWDGIYYVESATALATIYNGLSVTDKLTVTADAFYALNPKPPVQQFYNVYDLSVAIGLGYTVDNVIVGVTPDPTIAAFKTAGANIQQVFDEFKQSKYGAHRLTAMIGALYTVQQIVTGVTATPALTIADFKDAGAPIQQVYNQFKTSGTYILSAMINMETDPYTVQEIVADVTTDPALTIADFKAAGANIQQVYTQFGLSEMIIAGYYVKDIVAGVTSPRALFYNDFFLVSTPLWNLMTYYLFADYSVDLLSGFTVTEIKDASADSRVAVGNLNRVASHFQAENASIVQMLNAFTLAELIHLYTTTALVEASKEAGVTTIDYNKNLTIAKMQSADDELYEMMNYYSLTDLLQVDYSVADLVTASNLRDGSGNYRVTVTGLQNLGDKLTSFVTANATLGKVKLWNLINYFELSALLSYYSVHELNATSSDTRVSVSKTVTIASLKAASAPDQDMLTEFGLQAMWDAGYNVSQLKAVKVDINVNVTVTVAQLWALSVGSGDTGHRAKPTIQELYTEYGLQKLWTYFADVAQIYDGLTVPPTVAQFWGLSSSSRPTVQELKSSSKYGLQELWTGIYSLEPTTAVATIRTGLTPTPTAADFNALTQAPTPTVNLLSAGGYSLTNLIEALYTVAQIRNITTGIGVNTYGRQTSPTLAAFKAANAPLWQLLNASINIDIPDAGGNTGFDRIDFIKAGYTVSELVTAANLKVGSNYLVTANSGNNWESMNVMWFYPDNFSTDTTTTGLTLTDKTNLLCDVLSNFEPGACINTYGGGGATGYYAVPKLIEASNAKNDDNTYKVTLVANQRLDTKLSRFITGTNKIYAYDIYKLLRYRSVFTTFSILELEQSFGTDEPVTQIVTANNYYDTTGNSWDATHADWRVTVAELKSANVPIAHMINHYGQTKENLQLLLDAGYTISELRIASIPTSLYNRITAIKFLLLASPKTIRELQNGGYGLQELLQGVAPNYTESISPLLNAVTGYTPVPTIADFMELESVPRILQLYNAFGIQKMYDAIAANINSGITIASVKEQASPTVAQWWALSPKPTVSQLSTGGYTLQEIWNGIYEVTPSTAVSTIKSGLSTTVAQFWVLTSGKPTIQQLSTGGYTLQEIWTGIYSITSERANAVSNIRTDLSTTVAQFWALTSTSRPTVLQLSDGGYTLQEIWNGIYAVTPSTAVSTIKSGLSTTVAQFWALTSGKPTIQQLSTGGYSLQNLWDYFGNVSQIYNGLTVKPTIAQFNALNESTRTRPTLRNYLDSYNVAEVFASGYTITEILTAVSNESGSKTVAQIVADLVNAGCKIVIPAPRITAASFLSGTVTVTVVQASPDTPITKYWYSHSSNGGVTWSDYAVVNNTVNNSPLLPNGSGHLFLTGFSTADKLHSFRLRAESYGVSSNTSNTHKNLYF